jgi:DNA-directed RNA polymerases I, II, and III subunit RPABC1
MVININTHGLVPKHIKLNETDKKKLFEQHHVDIKSLPKILVTDPAIEGMNLKQGDVVKIERISRTAGTTNYYRVVIS